MGRVFEQLADMIRERSTSSHRLIVAIDGRCAAGKTTLAARLQQELDGTVYHMDDYFLRPEQRTAERLDTPGGNVDYERFYSEVLLPLRNGAERIAYQPYDCRTQTLQSGITVHPCAINIVEGAYSCHPALWSVYDLRICLTISPEEQLQRIQARNGNAGAIPFVERWIPLEERYLSAYRIAERCDLCIETSQMSVHSMESI